MEAMAPGVDKNAKEAYMEEDMGVFNTKAEKRKNQHD